YIDFQVTIANFPFYQQCFKLRGLFAFGLTEGPPVLIRALRRNRMPAFPPVEVAGLRCWLLAGCLLLSAAATYALGPAGNPASTLPSATDPRIKTFNEPHMSWLPVGPPRHQLLLFLPGTGGKPRSQFPFANTAAELGYHVTFLMYPDALAA